MLFEGSYFFLEFADLCQNFLLLEFEAVDFLLKRSHLFILHGSREKRDKKIEDDRVYDDGRYNCQP